MSSLPSAIRSGISNNRVCLTVAACGIALTGIVGYIVYFDYKRRASPDYKEKIRENREKKQEARMKSKGMRKIPNPRNQQAMHQYFFEEMSLGEELLNEGNVEQGVIHMANSVFASGQPVEMIRILQQTLQPPIFDALSNELQDAAKRYAGAKQEYQMIDRILEKESSSAAVTEEDEDVADAGIVDEDELE